MNSVLRPQKQSSKSLKAMRPFARLLLLGAASVFAVRGEVDPVRQTDADREKSVERLEKIYRDEGDYKEAEKYERFQKQMDKKLHISPAPVSEEDGSEGGGNKERDAVYKQIERIYKMEGNKKQANVYKNKLMTSGGKPEGS